MKIGRVFPDLLTPLTGAASAPARGARPGRVPLPGGRGRRAAVLRAALGEPRRPVGTLVLVGSPRALGRGTLARSFPRELGQALEHVWRLHRRALRMSVLNEITRLMVSSQSLDDVFRAFSEGAARLVRFDSIGVSLLDAERAEFEIVDVVARALPLGSGRDARMPVAGTLLAEVAASGVAVRVDDVERGGMPEASRRVFGAVTLAAARPGAFDDADVEVVAELARPLASAIEQRRLLEESRRRTDELAALYATSQLITARLDIASVLDRISRSVSGLIGATGCGIGLLDAARTRLEHAAAHGFRSEEWRDLSMPVGEGLMGRAAQTGSAIRVDDVRTDPRSAPRDGGARARPAPCSRPGAP